MVPVEALDASGKDPASGINSVDDRTAEGSCSGD